MDKMPGTLLMKDQEEIDAQIAMIVMDQEIVICMGCAQAIQDLKRMQTIDTMKLKL